MKKIILTLLLISSPAAACVVDKKPDYRTDAQKFEDWDKNGDGSIDYSETYSVLTSVSLVAKQNDWKHRMENDTNKNSRIEIQEFPAAFPEINC